MFNDQKDSVTKLTQGAVIAAVYVVLCVVFAAISYGEVQVRIAEALTILPVFTPAAIPGLFIGCIISNLIGGATMLDIVFGSLATLIGAIGTYMLRSKPRWIAIIPPIISNTIIIPLVLKYGYGVDLPIWMLMISLFIGEFISCGIFGLIFAAALDKAKIGRILTSPNA
ncbi:MAG: QueT transporter family protein [Eubacteriales bacterium]|nr:QueT transporter family protein [Eubacteriales bacterium]